MKLPFAGCLGGNLKDVGVDPSSLAIFGVNYGTVRQPRIFYVFRLRYRRFYCRLCNTCGLGHWWFVLGLGFLGIVVAITDIMDILHASERGPLLTQNIWRNRWHRSNQRLVSPEAERDMKLMVTILSVEHYLLMIFGVLQTNPALLMPWLTMEAIIIALESVFFGMRLFVEGLALSRAEVIMSAIVVHNWFQVFCFFRKYVSMCDL